MSSWSSSYPPPPRRSRSRSPSRGGGYSSSGRPAYADGYSENYRQDWDGYDRDRYHDRERPPYDYGRRGRSRSPMPVDEAGRKRRRSMSPYDRERYDPRPRYSDDYDGHSSRHGYTSPQRHPPYPSRRAPPDPHTFDYPASLKQFADWFRYYYPAQATEEDNADKAAEQEAGDGSKPRNGIKTRWEKYKKDFAANQLQTMFNHHRKSPWFAEKYDPAPEFEALRIRVRKEGWKGRLNTFLDDLEQGHFDPDLNESQAAHDEPSSPSGVAGKDGANGDASGAGGDENKDEDMTFTVDQDEDDPHSHRHELNGNANANGKASENNRRTARGEEISVPAEGNQVMIRTIPPDIGRVKLEEACSKIPGYVYLALGDPLQKRNYYRAGWLRFKDDADMSVVMSELSETKIEGFKLHVTHNLRPFVNKVRYAPEVASKPDRLEKDLENVKKLASLLEEQAAKVRAFKPSATSNAATTGQPTPTVNGEGHDTKAGDGDAAMRGSDRENGQQQEEEEEDEEEPKESGSEAVERRTEKIMGEMRDQGLVDVNDVKAYEEKKTVVSLDMYLAYLRAAYHTCYYCAVVTDHLEELQRKCLKHERKPLSRMLMDEIAEKERKDKEGKAKEDGDDEGKEKEEKEGEMNVDVGEDKNKIKERERDKENGKVKHDAKDWKRNDERWLEWLDTKVALLINRDGVDPREYGGKSYEEELSKAVEPFLKQEDEGKFRCKTCQKLFKATSFVEKHIANKHPDLVKSLEDVPYFNNFALDPHHIQPFAHPPTTVGNSSQIPPPQAYGIQGPVPFQGDFGRGGPPTYFPGAFPPGAPAYYWDPTHQGGAYPPPPGFYPPRREDVNSNRRLSDRISGYASAAGPGESVIPAGAGLPPKPTPAALDTALVSGNIGGGGRRGTRNNSVSGGIGGPPPPPPPDAKEDPRAAGGKRISYHDMDLVAEGDVELMY